MWESSEEMIEWEEKSQILQVNIFWIKDNSELIRSNAVQDKQKNYLDNKDIFDLEEDVVVISGSANFLTNLFSMNSLHLFWII